MCGDETKYCGLPLGDPCTTAELERYVNHILCTVDEKIHDALLMGCCCDDEDKNAIICDISRLRCDLIALKTKIESICCTLRCHNNAIGSLELTVGKLEQRVNVCETAITEIQLKIDGYDERLAVIEEEQIEQNSRLNEIDVYHEANNAKNNEQDRRLNELETAIDNIRTDIDTIENTITELRNDMETADAAINTKINVLENRVGVAENNIATNTANIAVNRREIDQLDGRVDSLEDRIDDLEQADIDISANISDLETRVTRNTTNITTNTSDIANLKAADIQHDAKDVELDSKYQNLANRVTKLETDGVPTTPGGDDDEFRNRLNALETSQSVQDGKISALETTTTNNSTEITNVKGELNELKDTVSNLPTTPTKSSFKVTDNSTNKPLTIISSSSEPVSRYAYQKFLIENDEYLLAKFDMYGTITSTTDYLTTVYDTGIPFDAPSYIKITGSRPISLPVNINTAIQNPSNEAVNYCDFYSENGTLHCEIRVGTIGVDTQYKSTSTIWIPKVIEGSTTDVTIPENFFSDEKTAQASVVSTSNDGIVSVPYTYDSNTMIVPSPIVTFKDSNINMKVAVYSGSKVVEFFTASDSRVSMKIVFPALSKEFFTTNNLQLADTNITISSGKTIRKEELNIDEMVCLCPFTFTYKGFNAITVDREQISAKGVALEYNVNVWYIKKEGR